MGDLSPNRALDWTPGLRSVSISSAIGPAPTRANVDTLLFTWSILFFMSLKDDHPNNGALPQFRWLTRKPRWTEDDREWPFVGLTPTLFIAQTHVPETPVTAGLVGGEMVFLFAGKQADAMEYRILPQECGQQTAEAHYRAEELMAAYEQNPSDLKAIERIIKQGDKWVHAFIVGQPNLSTQTLSLVATSGKGKEVKDRAKKRLNQTVKPAPAFAAFARYHESRHLSSFQSISPRSQI